MITIFSTCYTVFRVVSPPPVREKDHLPKVAIQVGKSRFSKCGSYRNVILGQKTLQVRFLTISSKRLGA